MTRNNFGQAVAALAGHDRPTQCRAEQLLAQQQVQGDWEFINARRYESSCTDAIHEVYEVVEDLATRILAAQKTPRPARRLSRQIESL
jgi:hypothetical protein